MRLRDFIRENRKELDEIIGEALGGIENHHYRNDNERRDWILNDEGLYHWARFCGVNI